jgi:hypothetical protein
MCSEPYNRYQRRIRLWDVDDMTFLKYRLTDGGKVVNPYASAALYSPKRFVVLIPPRSWFNPVLASSIVNGILITWRVSCCLATLFQSHRAHFNQWTEILIINNELAGIGRRIIWLIWMCPSANRLKLWRKLAKQFISDIEVLHEIRTKHSAIKGLQH